MTQPSDTFSFPDNELKILEFWRSHNTFQKSLDKTAQGPVYAFYDGPPFATGLPHHGHLDISKHLLDADADSTLFDQWMETPHSIAQHEGHRALAKLLEQHD